MPKGPIRRGQLIAPFGVGAMVVMRDGSSLIVAGLDHWFEPEDPRYKKEDIDIEEFKVAEWRLQHLLGVNHFRLPPDFRSPSSRRNNRNCYLTVPFLRFPTWHVCPSCGLMSSDRPLTLARKEECPECKREGKTRYVEQVSLVAMCKHGHLQDFPWREWVHGSAAPQCTQPMHLKKTGGIMLSGQRVECACGAQRTLAYATEGELPKEFCCQGKRPWLGTDDGEPCDEPLKGAFRTAMNVYYPHAWSSLYLPRESGQVPTELVDLLDDYPVRTVIDALEEEGVSIRAENLRRRFHEQLQPYTVEQIRTALQARNTPETGAAVEVEPKRAFHNFRQKEYAILRTDRDGGTPRIRSAAMSGYGGDIAQYFSRVMLVDKLKETRVFTGFSRILPENTLTFSPRRELLWRCPPPYGSDWLPAQVVYGEGIFLEFNEAMLKAWELRDEVMQRAKLLDQKDDSSPYQLGPRLILLHTFAHVLMNQLTFECGYSSAALRERLYVSDDEDAPMSGVLIYTAAGDADGTMGGLVSMGGPGKLEPVLGEALDRARWCSADPVCMESVPKGPDSCNLAACHSCALVPETACETNNRFLDRALLIGSLENTEMGFFC